MAYQEKSAIVNIISTILISVFYWLYVLQRFQEESFSGTEVFKFWGSAFILLVVVSTVFKVIITIVFNIFNTIATQEEDPSFADERDKLIDLKATRNTLYLFSIGILLAMGTLVIDMPPTAMFIVLLFSGIAADVFGDMSKLYLYRRGF